MNDSVRRRNVDLAVPLVVLCILLLGAGGCATVGRWQEVYSLVSGLAAGGSRQQARASPREEVRYVIDGRPYRADLYRPAEPARAALVLVHGFTELGKADPRLRHFAESLARVRFLVLAPEVESLTRFNVSTENIDVVRDSVAYMARQAEPADGHLGLAAISYSAGPAILAALETDAPVEFILSVGGYYDLIQTITFATTGYYHKDGE